MARQRSLDFGTERLAAIWKQVPELCRKQTRRRLQRPCAGESGRRPMRAAARVLQTSG